MLARIGVSRSSTLPFLHENPMLVRVDADDDRPLVAFTGASELTFVEPIAIAAVATPACTAADSSTAFGDPAAPGAPRLYFVGGLLPGGCLFYMQGLFLDPLGLLRGPELTG